MLTVVSSQKIPSLFLTSIMYPDGGKTQGITYAINVFQVCFSSPLWNTPLAL